LRLAHDRRRAATKLAKIGRRNTTRYLLEQDELDEVFGSRTNNSKGRKKGRSQPRDKSRGKGRGRMGQEESRIVGDDVPPQTLRERSLGAVAEMIKDGSAKRIAVLTGAGISTAAGIPDFRSPKTGLYANLARLNLPHAEAVFDINYFRQNPEPFYLLAQELYPGKFYPTISHAFIALLAKKGLLLQLFTQNIDTLESRAGVPRELIVEAHGSFATQRCIECGREYPDDEMRKKVDLGQVPRCGDYALSEQLEGEGGKDENSTSQGCGGLVKPDIVFFGESLPPLFRERAPMLHRADILLIIGTSLSVHPFAGLPQLVQDHCPRVLFNLEQVGGIGGHADDVLALKDCDSGIRELADALGWRDELEAEWRRVVGDEEAERQLRGVKANAGEMEAELEKMTERVEKGLKLDDEAVEDDGSTSKAANAGKRNTLDKHLAQKAEAIEQPAADDEVAGKDATSDKANESIASRESQPSSAASHPGASIETREQEENAAKLQVSGNMPSISDSQPKAERPTSAGKSAL
jgi:NAD+-dependent protein deacetylase SIR2